MDNFSIQTKIYFGDDVLDHLSELNCKKALIVTDPFIVTSGLLDMIVHPLVMLFQTHQLEKLF